MGERACGLGNPKYSHSGHGKTHDISKARKAKILKAALYNKAKRDDVFRYQAACRAHEAMRSRFDALLGPCARYERGELDADGFRAQTGVSYPEAMAEIYRANRTSHRLNALGAVLVVGSDRKIYRYIIGEEDDR